MVVWGVESLLVLSVLLLRVLSVPLAQPPPQQLKVVDELEALVRDIQADEDARIFNAVRSQLQLDEALKEDKEKDKRAQTFVRFGKRAQTFVRFGRSAPSWPALHDPLNA